MPESWLTDSMLFKCCLVFLNSVKTTIPICNLHNLTYRYICWLLPSQFDNRNSCQKPLKCKRIQSYKYNDSYKARDFKIVNAITSEKFLGFNQGWAWGGGESSKGYFSGARFALVKGKLTLFKINDSDKQAKMLIISLQYKNELHNVFNDRTLLFCF